MEKTFKPTKCLLFYIVSILVFNPLIYLIFALILNESISDILVMYYTRPFSEADFLVFILFFSLLPYFLYNIVLIFIGIFKYKHDYKLVLKNLSIAVMPFFLMFIIIIFADIFIFRGYYLSELCFYKDKKSEVNFTYEIEKVMDGWKFKLKNEDLNFRFFEVQRNYKPILNLDDSLIIKYCATRIKIEDDSTLYEDGSGFSSGTGLGFALIFPKEEFEAEFSDIYVLITQYYLYSLKYLKVNNDSVNVRFFIPIYDFESNQPVKVFSNPIKINYQKIQDTIEKILKENQPLIDVIQ